MYLCVMEFKYETIRETEKAILAKVPYWEATNEDCKKHKQHFFECWLPKSAILSGAAYSVAFNKIEEKRLSNPYQRGLRLPTPEKYKTMGQYAPVKEKVVVMVVDIEKCDQLKKELMIKYGCASYDRDFFISPVVSEDVSDLARILRNPENHIGNSIVPMKQHIKYI